MKKDQSEKRFFITFLLALFSARKIVFKIMKSRFISIKRQPPKIKIIHYQPCSSQKKNGNNLLTCLISCRMPLTSFFHANSNWEMVRRVLKIFFRIALNFRFVTTDNQLQSIASSMYYSRWIKLFIHVFLDNLVVKLSQSIVKNS